MSGLLLSSAVLEEWGAAIRRIGEQTGERFDPVVLPEDPAARLDPAACARIEIGFFSADLYPHRSRAFFAAAQGAAELRWLHLFNTGTDHPIFQRFLDRGVRLTNAPAANAGPIARSAITALLMLSRGFLHYADAQRRRAWEGISGARAPRDLEDEVLVIIGVGAIGSEIARLGRALGLHVIGIRRSPVRPGDPVDELCPPERLLEILPRADWLVLACPLTEATRGLIDARALGRLPPTARILNVARGELIDENALIEALRTGRLAGAYLDVFRTEPLPPASPLWRLPNVIVTPHNSGVSAGSWQRQGRSFVANLERWARAEPLASAVG